MSCVHGDDCPKIVHEVDRGVHQVEICRPEQKNALNLEMYSALEAAFEAAAADPQARALHLRGRGGAFTAGNDLRDFLEQPPEGEDSPVLRFLRRLVSFPLPLVAEVEGPAVGIGTTLLLHSDLVYAAEGARFALPFVPLGLVPEAAATYLLPRLVGQARASELLLLGRPFDAAAALSLGLVSGVYPAEQLRAEVDDRLNALRALPPGAVRATKALLRQSYAAPMAAALDAELEIFVERLGSPEAREALSAFFEKRRPRFGDPSN